MHMYPNCIIQMIRKHENLDSDFLLLDTSNINRKYKDAKI